jgi:hypothetical protein
VNEKHSICVLDLTKFSNTFLYLDKSPKSLSYDPKQQFVYIIQRERTSTTHLVRISLISHSKEIIHTFAQFNGEVGPSVIDYDVNTLYLCLSSAERDFYLVTWNLETQNTTIKPFCPSLGMPVGIWYTSEI